MATRFWSPDSGGGESVSVRACASSSLVTGFAFRTSGSPDAGAVELAAKAFRVSGGPSVGTGDATGALVAAAPLFGAAGPDPPVATAGVPVAYVFALELPFPGASRCTLRRNFIPRKPTTKTTIPTMSGIGETRLLPPVATGRLRCRTTGAETGLARSFSWRYE